MISFSVLNSGDEAKQNPYTQSKHDPDEAYSVALRNQKHGLIKEAADGYRKLLRILISQKKPSKAAEQMTPHQNAILRASFINYARSLRSLGAPEKAVNVFKQAAFLQMDDSKLWLELGEMALAEDDISSAILFFERGMARSSSSLEKRRFHCLLKNTLWDGSMHFNDEAKFNTENLLESLESRNYFYSLNDINIAANGRNYGGAAFGIALEAIRSLQKKGVNNGGLCVSLCSASEAFSAPEVLVGDKGYYHKTSRSNEIEAGESVDNSSISRKRKLGGDEQSTESVRTSKRVQKKAGRQSESESVFDFNLATHFEYILPQDRPIVFGENSIMTLTEIHEKHRKNISLLELFEELLHKSCKVLTEKFTEERRIKSQKIEHVTIVERCKVVAEITNAAFNSVDFFRSFLFTAFSEPCKHSEAQRQTYLSLFLEMDSLSAFDFGSITEVGADSTLNMVLCVSEFLFDCVSRAEDEILRNRRCFVNWWTLFLKLFNFKLSEGCIDARLSIRNLFLQAHVLEMQSLEDAGSYYGLCLNAIEALGDQNGMGDVDIPNNISVLNAQAVRTKIVGISCKLYIQETSDLSKKGDHREVLLRLCPFFFGSFECASVKDTFPNDWPYVLQFGRNYVTIEATSTERHRIMDILVQAANQVGSNEEKFFCLAKSIVLLVRDFDSLPLLVFIKKTSETLQKCITFIRGLQSREWLCTSLDNFHSVDQKDGYNFKEQLISCLYAIIRMSWVMMQGSYNNIFASRREFLVFAVRSWSVFFLLHKLYLPVEGSETKNYVERVQRLAHLGHEILGEVAACTEDEGIFLRIIQEILSSFPGGEASGEIYQCYSCLYGLSVKIDGESVPEPHDVSRVSFDMNAAGDVFSVVLKYVNQKLARGYKTIPTDLRECIDQISQFFSEPPFEQKLVLYNKRIIDVYLDSEMAVSRRPPYIGAKLAYAKNVCLTEHQDVYLEIFHLRAKIALSSFKQKTAIARTWKTFETLESIMIDLKFNVYLNPSKFESWLQLGHAFVSLSNEHLSWSAKEIVSSSKKIRDYQKKAFHCFTQAYIIMRDVMRAPGSEGHTPIPADVLPNFLTAFGQLCYMIVTKPMATSAVQSARQSAEVLWRSRNEFLPAESDIGDDHRKDREVKLLAIARMCYRLAMRHDRTWLYPYMLAKIKEKTDKSNSNAIIALYKKAIEIAPDNWTTKEQEIILDPRYSLVSYLAKNLLTDVIQPADVVKALGTTYIKDHPRHPDDDMEDSKRNMSKEHGFELLCQELGNIKSIDKKRWHHKPFWRQHWILANFFKDVNAAKTELLSLFHFKTTSKTFVNFWRPEFERPGKHFVYIDKYVGALISLLVQTRDLDNLATLIKKTKRADDILLHPTDICAKALEGFKDIVGSKVEDRMYWKKFSEKVSIQDLQNLAKDVERRLASVNIGDNDELALLVQLVAVKRVQDEDESDSWFDDMIVDCYAKICITTVPECGHGEVIESADVTLLSAVLKKAMALYKAKTSKARIGPEEQELQSNPVLSQIQLPDGGGEAIMVDSLP